ncbi:MAG: L-threonylcarbamoyladenylate synthase [Clostridia bacterium]|nr:L-threonylcarbamoyladenylate synthase [Clostridia bacterium]
MTTQVLAPDASSLALAARLLADGQLVAFPTETVYGLGANAFDEKAVLSVFEAKGRPADNPLIVHIWSRSQLDDICDVPEAAYPLMDAFWPGPLTILFPKKPAVPSVVTAGLDTVAVRMPSHPVASAMLRECGLPVAAPSANSSGRPSPTTARYVLQDMDGKIPLILDGGDCDVGVESTVLDICHGQPTVLRPGGVTKEMLERVLGCEVLLAGSILRPLRADEKALSPGMRYRHYAPKGTVTLVEGAEADVLAAMRFLCETGRADGKKTCVMCFTEHADVLRDCDPHDIGRSGSDTETAHRLFSTLRRLDDEDMDLIYSEVVPPEGVGLAVMNRLGRAAAFRRIDARALLDEVNGG